MGVTTKHEICGHTINERHILIYFLRLADPLVATPRIMMLSNHQIHKAQVALKMESHLVPPNIAKGDNCCFVSEHKY